MPFFDCAMCMRYRRDACATKTLSAVNIICLSPFHQSWGLVHTFNISLSSFPHSSEQFQSSTQFLREKTHFSPAVTTELPEKWQNFMKAKGNYKYFYSILETLSPHSFTEQQIQK